MTTVSGRALHFVLKIGDRKKNATFFRNILGMQVLRHEEFKKGCEAECNGPYDNRWSKTMIGYGPESTHFVIELTYNYGVKSYKLGNDLGGITIKNSQILKRAKEAQYPIEQDGADFVLVSPDGYKFRIIDQPNDGDVDPVEHVALHVSDIEKSRKYWQDLLKMKLLDNSNDSLLLSYGDNQAALRLVKAQSIDRADAYGRIAFAVPAAAQQPLYEAVQAAGSTVLTPLIKLDTPGKATVSVLILADPDGHEICFVDEEGFGELSQVESDGNERLDKFIGKDPFQEVA